MSNNCVAKFTLQGSQPYVLTGNWPRGFFPNRTEFVADYSMQNVTGANDVGKYHPVNFSGTILRKGSKDSPMSKYAYETLNINKC